MVRKRTAEVAAFVTHPSGDKAVDDFFARLRTAAIARILQAVRKSTDDEVQLATDILDAYVLIPSKLDPDEASKAPKRLKKVKGIRKAVEEQAALIRADPYISEAIGESRGLNPPSLRLRLELRILEEKLSILAKKWRSKADLPPEKDRRPSKNEWLTGVSLPLVYERHFGRRAARSRNVRGAPTGPMVRFIEATLLELKLKYSREAIVRAFTRLKAERDHDRTKRTRMR
jgi:hypothetical protein